MDIGTWGDRGLVSIAQSGHIRLGALLYWNQEVGKHECGSTAPPNP